MGQGTRRSSRRSCGFHTFTRYTCTVVTRIYSAVTDSVGLYNMGRFNLNLFLACIRVHKVWVTRKWTSREIKGYPTCTRAFSVYRKKNLNLPVVARRFCLCAYARD